MFIFFSVYSQAEVVMKRNRPIKRLKVHFRRQVLSIFYVAESWGGGRIWTFVGIKVKSNAKIVCPV